MFGLTQLRMLNRARIDVLFSSGRGRWHYPANLSVLCEEREDVKDVLLSHLIAYSYLPTLTEKERAELRLKVYSWNIKIENTNEDEMLDLLINLKKKANNIKRPAYIDRLFLSIPMGLEGKGGRFIPSMDIANYLLGPVPFFSYAIEQSRNGEVWLYEILNCMEMAPDVIMMAYEKQEKTLKNFLGEQHYSFLFPYLLLLNRQGKYIFGGFYYLQYSKEFLIPPVFINKREGERIFLVSIKDVFAHEKHREWFLREFIEENRLYEAYKALERVVGIVELSRFVVVIRESGVTLAYTQNSSKCFLLEPEGLYRL